MYRNSVQYFKWILLLIILCNGISPPRVVRQSFVFVARRTQQRGLPHLKFIPRGYASMLCTTLMAGLGVSSPRPTVGATAACSVRKRMTSSKCESDIKYENFLVSRNLVLEHRSTVRLSFISTQHNNASCVHIFKNELSGKPLGQSQD